MVERSEVPLPILTVVTIISVVFITLHIVFSVYRPFLRQACVFRELLFYESRSLSLNFRKRRTHNQ